MKIAKIRLIGNQLAYSFSKLKDKNDVATLLTMGKPLERARQLALKKAKELAEFVTEVHNMQEKVKDVVYSRKWKRYYKLGSCEQPPKGSNLKYYTWRARTDDNNYRSAEVYLNQHNKETYGLRLSDSDGERFCGSGFTKRKAVALAIAFLCYQFKKTDDIYRVKV